MKRNLLMRRRLDNYLEKSMLLMRENPDNYWEKSMQLMRCKAQDVAGFYC